jgi:threonine dehydrogenase-like Zn-dependent dehydrogenase
MGRHQARTDLGREFGATDVVAERGEEGIARVRDLTGGPAPVRAYIDELRPDILNGTINPGKAFDATTNLDGVPAGYQDMVQRRSLKVLIKP